MSLKPALVQRYQIISLDGAGRLTQYDGDVGASALWLGDVPVLPLSTGTAPFREWSHSRYLS